jgi:hypothetical protein
MGGKGGPPSAKNQLLHQKEKSLKILYLLLPG